MSAAIKPLAVRYRSALQGYLQNASEEFLRRGYELGRRAQSENCGLLELVHIHHQELQLLLHEHNEPESALQLAGKFFAECLSPYEMSLQGAQEGSRALHHVNELMEAEIQRIAHALHDEAGQLLASLHLAVTDLASDLPEAAKWRLGDVEQLFRQIELELRDLSHELRPTVLDRLGLLPALKFLAESVAKRTALTITVSGSVGDRLPSAVETAVYRSVQEALQNVIKHAHAKTVRIELKRTASRLVCSVRDNGVGFSAFGRGSGQGLGLIGIRERLSALGGSMRITTEPGRGMSLIADIPFGQGRGHV